MDTFRLTLIFVGLAVLFIIYLLEAARRRKLREGRKNHDQSPSLDGEPFPGDLSDHHPHLGQRIPQPPRQHSPLDDDLPPAPPIGAGMLQRGFSANSPAPPVPEPDDHMSAAWQAGPADDLAADSAAAPPPPANTATEPFAAGATDSSATHANPLLPPEDQLGPLPSASPQASEPLAPPQQTAAHPAAAEADETPDPPEGFSDLIIALQVSAPAGGSFSGRDIQSALRRCELEYGDMQIYHYYTPQRRSLFFLANSLEPGSFDLTTMASISTAGLLFFLRLPTVLAGREAFEIMLEVAGKVATQLGGELRDQQGNALGKHELTGIRERIAAYEYKLKAHQRQMALLS